MLIVAQSGEIVNLDRMERVSAETDGKAVDGECWVMALAGSGTYTALGCYKNRGRAKDVMREITDVYIRAGRRVYRMPEE